MMDYYNENDPGAAAWLRELIKAGVIALGEVDERSIVDVAPSDLRGFTQCHFFAGIGGWSYALRLAGWPADRPIWTGSCPCQPFSVVGSGTGFNDERHLWPAFFNLISQWRPAIVVGEQVASKDAEPWLDLVFSDLESLDYACGAIAFPSAGVGAPHIRDRTYWLGHTDKSRLERYAGYGSTQKRQGESRPAAEASISLRVADAAGRRCGESSQDAGRIVTRDRSQGVAAGLVPRGHVNGFWSGADWLYCRDGKYRPVEPSTFPLAHGVPGRVGLLRGYGNAINPWQAAEFIQAFLDVEALL